jgi:pimeloyl-ACP methyl ester carboxylesterase
MPMLKRADAEIYYEVHGRGFPILLYAPGGLRSNVEFWGPNADGSGRAWMDPRKALSDQFTVIAMDQRNAGKSVAGVKPDHGWHTFATDHLALMDHLGFGKFFAMGGCIGGSYCFEAIEQAPHRVAGAVLQNPIGLWENKDTWDEAVSTYSKAVRSRDPSISEATIRSFGHNMFGATDFVFSVTRDFVKNCRTPLLLQPGNDKPHPAKTSEEIAALAPNLEVQKDWRGPAYLDESVRRVRAFLAKHTSAG